MASTSRQRRTIAADPLASAAIHTVRWEYLEVERSSNRPRSVNGRNLPNWKKGPSFWDYVDQLGAEEWELAAVVDQGRRWIFKRLRTA